MDNFKQCPLCQLFQSPDNLECRRCQHPLGLGCDDSGMISQDAACACPMPGCKGMMHDLGTGFSTCAYCGYYRDLDEDWMDAL